MKEKRTCKRALSAFLALAMCLSLLPGTAFAAQTGSSDSSIHSANAVDRARVHGLLVFNMFSHLSFKFYFIRVTAPGKNTVISGQAGA